MLLNGFAFLTHDLFARVANTFSFVRIRRVIAADICRHVPDEMFVDPFDFYLRVFSDGDFDSLRNRKENVMRETKVQFQDLALQRRFEAGRASRLSSPRP